MDKSNRKVSQDVNISKAGYYIIMTSCRLYGGNGTYPAQISAYHANTCEDDPFAGATYLSEYQWVTITRIEYLAIGINTFWYESSTPVSNFNTRTYYIRIPR